MKVNISKKDWVRIGRTTGWIRTSSDMRDMLACISCGLLFETEGDVAREPGTNPSEVWYVTYNNTAFEAQDTVENIRAEHYPNGQLVNDARFYKFFFKACQFSAQNFENQELKKGPEELVDYIYEVADMGTFFELVDNNNEIYTTERAIEQRDMVEIDDQRVGEYEKYGPDAPTPQY